MKIVILSIALMLFVSFGVLLGGCSPQERSGVSPIPQNRPTTWENQQIAR
ncbi:MAG: hypothetical protein PHS41_00870 [Victivallaceae bacterium]|nr:hypothetical protein [Victivallaceae bacterium]